jgi:putative addiction module component (TIGR02574 family)
MVDGRRRVHTVRARRRGRGPQLRDSSHLESPLERMKVVLDAVIVARHTLAPWPERCGTQATMLTGGLMKVVDLEAEALRLSATDRAKLVQTLIQSLDAISEEESEALWADEAQRRAAELDAHPELARPADEVFRRVRELAR